MADQADDQKKNEAEPKLLTPGEIARMETATMATKKPVIGTMEHFGDERSGQLSPSHTPGRKR